MKREHVPEEAELNELFGAMERLHRIFAPLAAPAGPAAIDDAEREARGAFRILYRHMHALATADLLVRLSRPEGFILGIVTYELDEMAHMSAEMPFMKRAENGLLEIAGLAGRFFSGGPVEGIAAMNQREACFYFLKGVTANNVSQVIKRIWKSENPVRHYVMISVNRHSASSRRYERSGELVVDGRAPKGEADRREATPEEAAAVAVADVTAADTPGMIVDMIFDRLRASRRFRPSLRVPSLRMAVFELLRSRHTPASAVASGTDPLQEYLLTELLGTARAALEETMNRYRWGDHPPDLREAFRRAGWEYLEEILRYGEAAPRHELLGRHVIDCDTTTYRNRYMGSFQHFLGVLWENFMKYFRAEPGNGSNR
ncbi:MAG: hypothetical protein PHQ19_06020 [Candidatus Krumholzibacteria bacterium]|nr:hypothetical protein [Candidatus Krumholzibacteria bacterium]